VKTVDIYSTIICYAGMDIDNKRWIRLRG